MSIKLSNLYIDCEGCYNRTAIGCSTCRRYKVTRALHELEHALKNMNKREIRKYVLITSKEYGDLAFDMYVKYHIKYAVLSYTECGYVFAVMPVDEFEMLNKEGYDKIPNFLQ